MHHKEAISSIRSNSYHNISNTNNNSLLINIRNFNKISNQLQNLFQSLLGKTLQILEQYYVPMKL